MYIHNTQKIVEKHKIL